MNRRGFLKAAASLVPATAMPSGAAVGMLSGGSAALGLGLNGYAGLAAAKNMALPEASAMGLAAKMAWDAYHDVQRGWQARFYWWAEYRRHRIAVRRGREQPIPAKVLFLRKKLKDLRRNACMNMQNRPPSSEGPQFVPRRLSHRVARHREKAALKRRGMFRYPWGEPV